MKPWWHIIRDRRFWRGPTIPYLIAAVRLARGEDVIASPGDYQADLLALLIDMRDAAPPNRWVAIEMCPGLNTLIARPYAQAPTHMHSIASPTGEGRAVYYLRGIKLPRRDVESLQDFLWREHEDELVACKLNRRVNGDGTDYEWARITKPERQAILATLKNPNKRSWPD
jgi:hypothetical protein